MRSEWGCTLQQALFRESLAAAVALWPALLSRHGVENTGMDYVTRARQKAKDKARKWIADHYTVKAGKRQQAAR